MERNINNVSYKVFFDLFLPEVFGGAGLAATCNWFGYEHCVLSSKLANYCR